MLVVRKIIFAKLRESRTFDLNSNDILSIYRAKHSIRIAVGNACKTMGIKVLGEKAGDLSKNRGVYRSLRLSTVDPTVFSVLFAWKMVKVQSSGDRNLNTLYQGKALLGSRYNRKVPAFGLQYPTLRRLKPFPNPRKRIPRHFVQQLRHRWRIQTQVSVRRF